MVMLRWGRSLEKVPVRGIDATKCSLLNAQIGLLFIGSTSKSDAARPRLDPRNDNSAAIARGNFLAPLNNENPVARGRKNL